MNKKLLFATKSLRRHALLQQIGVPFEVVRIDTDEQLDPKLPPQQNVQNIASEKAIAAQAQYPQQTILAADTMVVIDQHILGKPKDQDDAIRMLKLLSGATHQVITVVALINEQGALMTTVSVSNVRFKILSDSEVFDYWCTGEPQDKAGAYGIQGRAAVFVEHIEGSHSGIMGLPLFETAELIRTNTMLMLNPVDQIAQS